MSKKYAYKLCLNKFGWPVFTGNIMCIGDENERQQTIRDCLESLESYAKMSQKGLLS